MNDRIEPMRTYAVGDIHGMIEPLQRALNWIKEDAQGVKHRIVFLGDYVDRGPASREVLNLLRYGHQNWIMLKGNHEDLMAQAILHGGNVYHWEMNGGVQTRLNYDTTDTGIRALENDARFVDRLPLYFDDGVRFFCHAGIDPSFPLNKQPSEILVWDRNWFKDRRGEQFDPGRLIVHGHTPLKGKPYAVANSVNLDTSCVFGYGLTVACWIDPKLRDYTTCTFQTEVVEA